MPKGKTITEYVQEASSRGYSVIEKLSILYVIVGAVVILAGIICLFLNGCENVRSSVYGGDAYTGIQNAAAMTAGNISCLATICSFGFSFVLIAFGSMLALKGMTLFLSDKL